MIKIVKIKTDQLELNTGQIAGLPANPRQWTRTDIEKIAKSLKETPELFEMRPCIVKEHNGKYIILGGNLRYTGARQNGEKEVPCAIVPDNLSIEKLKQIVVKDNGSFGAWDFDALANEWDELPLAEWGVPAWGITKDTDTTFGTDTGGNSEPAESGALPPELDGLDLNPDDLEKLEGTDETPMERIIITFTKEQAQELATLLGLAEINKVVYKFDELPFK